MAAKTIAPHFLGSDEFCHSCVHDKDVSGVTLHASPKKAGYAVHLKCTGVAGESAIAALACFAHDEF